MKTSSRILVAGPSWIGDMVMAQSLFMALRTRLPEARIDVMAPRGTARLTARMPEVDASVEVDIAHGEFAWQKRRAAARQLRQNEYDQAIVLQRSAKAALIPWLAAIPKRTGYRGEFRYGLINDVRSLDKSTYPLKAEHYALLGTACEGDALPPIAKPRLIIDDINQAALIERHALDLERPIVGFAPGAAYGGAKQWPASHYAKLAKQLDAQGWACWIFGSAADRDIANRMACAAPRHAINLCEQTSLSDIVDLAALTTRFVGNDTGVMHLASASARSVIGIYGSTDPDYAPPLAPQSQRLWLDLDCSPCRSRVCPLGHNACMRDLSVTDVLAACLDPGQDHIHALHRITG